MTTPLAPALTGAGSAAGMRATSRRGGQPLGEDFASLLGDVAERPSAHEERTQRRDRHDHRDRRADLSARSERAGLQRETTPGRRADGHERRSEQAERHASRASRQDDPGGRDTSVGDAEATTATDTNTDASGASPVGAVPVECGDQAPAVTDVAAEAAVSPAAGLSTVAVTDGTSTEPADPAGGAVPQQWGPAQLGEQLESGTAAAPVAAAPSAPDTSTGAETALTDSAQPAVPDDLWTAAQVSDSAAVAGVAEGDDAAQLTTTPGTAGTGEAAGEPVGSVVDAAAATGADGDQSQAQPDPQAVLGDISGAAESADGAAGPATATVAPAATGTSEAQEAGPRVDGVVGTSTGSAGRPGATETAATALRGNLGATVAELARAAQRDGSGTTRIVLRLDPPELGNVTVALTVRGGDVRVSLLAADVGAATALDSRRQDVRDALADAGLSLDSYDVQADSRQGQQRQPEGRGQAAVVSRPWRALGPEMDWERAAAADRAARGIWL